jgi:predicted metal-binding protein
MTISTTVLLLSLILLAVASNVHSFFVSHMARTRSNNRPASPYRGDNYLSMAPTITTEQTISKQFKIMTCSATSCAQKRKILGLDPLATYGAFYARIQDGAYPEIELEEVSCLGACKKSPCVAVEHEDYEGIVALEGMTDDEFSQRVYVQTIHERCQFINDN